ncbi:MAG: LysE family translocator [Castellaniella sp.]|uniref:LysE family translocator n=1 Tax=Castellaniella sp. TaxID=1955812 RepID=UPI00122262B3|nr:LysE family translocator [Castellaniella sp.]TAN25807.1 MAG: LysE family translocator [Castellaniella sp.]
MNDLPLLLAFVAAISILTITPGVDTAIVLRAATANGRKPAAMAAIGVALGCLIWGASVSLGLGVLLQASELAYTVLKAAGAVYLIWLGGKLLLRPRTALGTDTPQGRTRSGGDAFWRGFLTNLLNPKVGVFYVTFLPQFVPADVSVAAYSFFLASIHVLLVLAWFSLLIAATAPLNQFLRRSSAVKTLDRLTGGIFIAFGLKLATSSAR